jgi:hypothetical protein
MVIKLHNHKILFKGSGIGYDDRCCCPSCTIVSDQFNTTLTNWDFISGNHVLESGSLKQYGGLNQAVSKKANVDIGSAYITASLNLNMMNIGDEVRLSPQITSDGTQQVYGFVQKTAANCFTVGTGENGQVLSYIIGQYTDDLSDYVMSACINDNILYAATWKNSMYGVYGAMSSNVIGNSGDRAGLYSNTTGSILWKDVTFSHYGDISDDLHCPTCSGVTSCTNFYEQWNDDQFECKWNLLYGSYPTDIHTGYPGYIVLPSGQNAYIARTTNLRGDNQYQRASTEIGYIDFYGPLGPICQIFCCDDGTLSTGAWAKLERVDVDGSQFVRFSIGIGTNVAKTYDYFGLNGDVGISICCEGERISGQCNSITLTDGNIGAPSGKYAGIKFNNLSSLYWRSFLYSRNKHGTEDPSCYICHRCSITHPVTDVSYDIPCYILVDVQGIQVPRPPIFVLGCTDFNGQFIKTHMLTGQYSQLTSWQGDDWHWVVYLLYYDNSWNVLVTPWAIDWINWPSSLYPTFADYVNGVTVFKKSFSSDWNPSEIYTWNNYDIPRNTSLESSQCFGTCRRWTGTAWVDCTNPGWSTTTCTITNVE